jgi:Flp pilus assembly protein TadG
MLRLRRKGIEGARGSVLMLMPAAVLIMIVLGAIVIDLSVLRMRSAELDNVATAAANDAAGQLADDAIYAGSGPALAQDIAELAVAASLAARDLDGVWVSGVEMESNSVSVSLGLEVEMIFGRALPGTKRTRQLSGEATARLLIDPTD